MENQDSLSVITGTNDSVEFNVKTGQLNVTGNIAKSIGLTIAGVICIRFSETVKNPTAKTILFVCGIVLVISAIFNGIKVN